MASGNAGCNQQTAALACTPTKTVQQPFNTRGFEELVEPPLSGNYTTYLGGAHAAWWGGTKAEQIPAGGIHAPQSAPAGSPVSPQAELSSLGGKSSIKQQAGMDMKTSNKLYGQYGQSLTTGVPYNNPFPLVLIKPLPVMKKDNTMHNYSIMLNATYNIDITIRKQNLRFFSTNFLDREYWADTNRPSSHLGINWSGLSGWPSGVWKAS